MIATEWRVPDAPLRASAASAQLIAAAGVLVLAQVVRRAFPVGDLYALKAVAVYGVVGLLAFGFVQRHHPFTRFGAANQVTTFRAMLVALVAAIIGEPRVPAIAAGAAAASLVITVLDGVDGWLARRMGTASAFGARFDMEIDALLILVLAILVWRFEKVGMWVVASGLLRYLFVAAGAIWWWMAAPLAPSRRRQAVCVVQVAGLTLAMVPSVAPPLSNGIALIALLTLAYSFLVDALWLWKTR